MTTLISPAALHFIHQIEHFYMALPNFLSPKAQIEEKIGIISFYKQDTSTSLLILVLGF